MPHLRAAYEKFHDQGFEILSVSFDLPKDRSDEALERWVQENGMVWRHAREAEGFRGPMARAFRIDGVPSLFLIGADGALEAMDGECRGDQLGETIARVLAKGKVGDAGAATPGT